MKISCPFCHQHYEVDAPTPDKKYRCLYCGEQFTGGMAAPVTGETEAPVPGPEVAREVEPAPASTHVEPPPRLREIPVAAYSAPTIRPTQARRALPVTALVFGIVAVIGFLAVIFVLLPLSGTVRDLQQEIADLRTDNQTLRQQLESLQSELAGRPAASGPEVSAQDFANLKQQLETLLATQNGIRSWQSKYTATLDQLVKMVEDQSMEQAFTRINSRLNELFAPQGAFARVYYAINQLSNAANDNLILLNHNLNALAQYTGDLADNIDKINDQYVQINRDLGNLFGRVNRLERNNSNFIYVSPIRPTPKPTPRPPKLESTTGISINIGG